MATTSPASGRPGPSPPRTPNSNWATFYLVLVTLFWGLSFPLMKNWQGAAEACPGGEDLASLSLIALRMMLALFFLGLAQPRLFRNPSAREHGVGALVGLAFFLGFALQVWGLARTTPALSAFITSLGSAWVPLLAWIFLRLPVSSITLLGLLVGVGGTAVLGIDVSKGWQLGGGEGRTLMASILFAVQILLLDRFGRRVRSNHLTVGFLGITGGLALVGNLVLAGFGPGLGSWLAWLGDMLCQPIVLCDLLLLTLLSTVLAFHLMNVYQPQVSAGRAALVYLLEPVFASVFSIVWGHDPLTWRLLVGGCLILGGNLLIEVPFWTQPKPPKTWAPNRPDAEK